MPFKKSGMKKKRSSAPRRKYVTRRPRMMGGFKGLQRTFTEVAQLSDLIVSQTSSGTVPGQTWAIAAASIPQFGQYKSLYNEYKILKIRFTYVPHFGGADQNQQMYNSGAGGTYAGIPTIAYAVQRDASSLAPLNELEVVTQNGCRVGSLRKVMNVTVSKPQPEIYVSTSAGGTSSWEQTGWLDTNSGANTAHFGVQTFLTDLTSNLAPGYSIARVYAHITFALRSSK